MGLFDRKDNGEELPYGYNRAVPQSYNAERPITAAACTINLKNQNEIAVLQQRKNSTRWQSDAWAFQHSVPVINFSSNLIRSVLSRVRYFPAVITNPNEPPTFVGSDSLDLDPAVVAACESAMTRLSKTPGGLSGLGAQIGINLWVAGEGTLVEFPPTPKNRMQATWKFLSVDQLVINGKNVGYKAGRNSKTSETLPKGTFMARIWAADPQFDDDATSSVQSVQDFCDEYLGYARLRRTITHARMNGGIFLIPDTLSAGELQTQDAAPELDDFDDEFDPASIVENLPDTEADEFEDELIEALTAPIEDESSAASIVPMILRGPAESLKEVRHLVFDRKIDEQLNKSSEIALEAIKEGLDIPQDMTSSQSNVKYSNSVKIDEHFYANHIEPLITAICDALTVVYLHPTLRAYGLTDDEIAKIVWWYDPSEILTRTDRTQAANDGYDRGILSETAWRQTNGFPESAAASGEEKFTKAVVNRAQISDQLLSAVLEKIAPELNEFIKQAAQAVNPDLSPRAKELLGYDNTQQTPPPAPGAPPAPTSPAPQSENPNPLADGVPKSQQIEPPPGQ